MIRIGLVGCGHIGAVHSMALRELGRLDLTGARVTATLDLDRERAVTLARHHDAEALGDLDELVAGVDLVWVTTWTSAHREAVEVASAAGRAVFCEKPLATSLAEAERVAAALARVPHQVGLVLRHAPVFAELAARVEDGRHGRVLAAGLRDDQYFPIQGEYASTWRADVRRAGGGTLLEHSIHDVDLLRRLFGDPCDIAARTSAMFGHPGIDDAVALTCTFAGGARASLVSVWHQILRRGSTRHLEVFCERGLLWTEDDHLGPLHVETDDGSESVDGPAPEWLGDLAVPEVLAKPLAQYAAADLSFLRRLEGPGTEPPGPNCDTALAAHRLVDAAYRSAGEGGVPVAVDPAR